MDPKFGSVTMLKKNLYLIVKICDSSKNGIESETKFFISIVLGKAREFQKNTYFCFIVYAKVFDCVDYNKLWKILRDGNTRPVCR